MDVAEELINVASEQAGQVRFTDKIWALDNMPHFTTHGMLALSKKNQPDIGEEFED